MTVHKSVDPKIIDDLIRRIMSVVIPDKVILFGSGAKGEMGPNSDLDILVVTSGPVHRGLITEEIYMNLIGIGQAVDVVVATPDDIERYHNNPYLVIEPALREGQVIYERGTSITG
jgi:uncharacterized protein